MATLLGRVGEVEIVAECGDGAKAVEAIRTLSPDLVFLDVQMPEFSGFEVLQTVGPADMPLVVFATAHDEYAVRAFEAHALDYLLKPFDEERVRRAVDRAREELAKSRRPRGRLEALVRSLRLDRQYLQRLVVKARGRVLFLKVSEVEWFEAAGNYVTAHVGAAQHLIRDTVAALEGKLDPEQVARIHRSKIVNLERVRELSAWFHGEQVLILKDGTELRVGRAFRARLQRFVDNIVE